MVEKVSKMEVIADVLNKQLPTIDKGRNLDGRY
jgi:hypothetical protein